MADLTTFIGVRKQPTGPVETFSGASAGETVDTVMETEDAAGILLRLTGGARAVVTISQVSAGRKNRLSWEIDGSESALAWHSEAPEELWLGHRGRPNELLLRERRRLPARPRRGLPGHLQAPLPRGLRGGRERRSARRAGLPDLRRRPRGGADRRRRRALARRAALGGRRARWWRDEAGPAHRRLPDADARRDRRLGGRQRLRDARGGVLAGRRGRRAPLRRASATSTSTTSTRASSAGLERRGLCDLGARLLPEPAVGRRGGARRRARAPAQGDRGRRRRSASTSVGTFVGRDRTKNLPDSLADFREVWPPLVAHAASTACGSRSRTAR